MIESEFDNIDKYLLRQAHIIHQIWFNFSSSTGSTSVPDKYRALTESWVINNPKWTHIVWNDVMGDWLVFKHYPDFWDTYANYKYPIQRVDAVRLCILHRYGGVYADMDTKCQGSVDLVLKGLTKNVAFARGKTPSKLKNTPSNYMMYSKPGEDFWLYAIEGAKKYGNGSRLLPYHMNIFNASGPMRIYKTMKLQPGATEYFDPALVNTYTKIESSISKNAIEKCIVIHEMHNSWLPTSEIGVLVLYILMIMLIIITGIVLAVKKMKSRSDSIGRINDAPTSNHT
jgi:mannosyltransferase OCH1-like enzyme